MAETSFHRLLKTVSNELKIDTIEYKTCLEDYNIEIIPIPNSPLAGLAVIFRVRIFDKKTKTKMGLIIKKVKSRRSRRIRNIIKRYRLEHFFYLEIYSSLKTFEEQNKVAESFLPFPEYVTSNRETNFQMIAFKDLHCERFGKIRSRLSENDCRIIFETYGRFHALFFCWKTENLEKFRILLKDLRIILLTLSPVLTREQNIKCSVQKALHALEIWKQDALMKNLKPYLTNANKVVADFMEYENNNSDNSCLLLGFCSLRSMMFKYKRNTNQMEAVKLLCFHSTKFGSPVDDLVNFFYTEILDTNIYLNKVHLFLDSYYESFSKTVKLFNQNPNQLLLKSNLLNQWKIFEKSKLLLQLKSTISISKENEILLKDSRNPDRYITNFQHSCLWILLQHLNTHHTL